MEAAYFRGFAYERRVIPDHLFMFEVGEQTAARVQALPDQLVFAKFSPSGSGQLKYSLIDSYTKYGILHIAYRYTRAACPQHVVVFRPPSVFAVSLNKHYFDGMMCIGIHHKCSDKLLFGVYLLKHEKITVAELKEKIMEKACEFKDCSRLATVSVFAPCGHGSYICTCDPLASSVLVAGAKKPRMSFTRPF